MIQSAILARFVLVVVLPLTALVIVLALLGRVCWRAGRATSAANLPGLVIKPSFPGVASTVRR
jgi:hypothetical protein